MDDTYADALVANLWEAFPFLFRLIRRGWKKGTEEGLSVYHYETLGILLAKEPMSMSQIRDRLGVAKSNLTPIVDGLVKKDLVRRHFDADDRRVVRISLTAKGRRFMNQGKERAKGDMKKLFGSLTDSELRILSASLQRLTDVLSQSSMVEG